MGTPFERPPVETKGENVIPISTDSLKNPAVSMNRNESGKYSAYIFEAQSLLKRIQKDGFWSSEQVNAYAEGYPGLQNALEVMRRNSLLKAIIEDKDQVMWDYPSENAGLIDLISDITSVKDTKTLDKFIGEIPSLNISSEQVYEGFYRLNITKEAESGTTYRFSLNIDSKNKKLTFLAFQPISELCVGFSEEIASSGFIRKLFESNPRTNIHVPEQMRREVVEREKRVQRAQERETNLQEQYNPKELSSWDTTNPNQHNPERFRYIVHAVTSEGRATQMAIARRGMMREGEDMEEIQRGSVFDDSETFLKRRFISASVIDQVHRSTWSSVGVILGVPKGNIVRAANQDIGSIPNERLLRKEKVAEAWQILEQTPTTSYNEVIVSGHNPDTGEVTEILGVFIIINARTGKPKDESLAVKARNFAGQRNIPLIEIPEPVRIKNNLPPKQKSE